MKRRTQRKRDMGWLVTETVEELNDLLAKNSGLRTLGKLRCLRFVKEDATLNLTALSHKIGVDRSTLREWRKCYLAQGLAGLLARGRDHQKNERTSALTPQMIEAVTAQMNDPKAGFQSFKQAHQWLVEHYSLKMSYIRFYKLARYRYKIRLKVPRPVNVKKDPEAESAFKKTSRKS